MCGVDAGIKDRHNNAVARKRRGVGADSSDAPGGTSGGWLLLGVDAERFDQLHWHRPGNGDDIRVIGECFDLILADVFHFD